MQGDGARIVLASRMTSLEIAARSPDCFCSAAASVINEDEDSDADVLTMAGSYHAEIRNVDTQSEIAL